MQYNLLTDEACRELAANLLMPTEQFRQQAYPQGDGMATIGYGYTFNRNNNASLFALAGISLSKDQQATLTAIDEAPASQKTALGLSSGISLTKAQAKALLMVCLTISPYKDWPDTLGMPPSSERAALLSITYNFTGAQTKVPEFAASILAGERAEAWFDMRYRMAGSTDLDANQGLYKDRYFESQVFSLNDTALPVVTTEAAIADYQMLQRHRAVMYAYDMRWGVAPDGEQVGPNRNLIALANNDRDIRSVTFTQSLNQSFVYASGQLESAVSEGNPLLDSAALAKFATDLRIMYASGDTPVVDARQNYGTTDFSNANHILIGKESGDILIGGDGSDLIIAGAGNESLVAGMQADTLVAGQALDAATFGVAGQDTIHGGEGFDTFEFVIGAAGNNATIIPINDNQKGAIDVVVGGSLTQLGGTSAAPLKFIKENNGLYGWSISGDNNANDTLYVYNKKTEELDITIPISQNSTVNTSFTIEIDDFDAADLAQAANAGFLGLHLALPVALSGSSAEASSPAPLNTQVGANAIRITSSSEAAPGVQTFAAGSSAEFNFSIGAALSANCAVKVTVSGASPSDFGVIIGNSAQTLGPDGSFYLNLTAGQTQVHFGLVDLSKQDGTSDIANGASITLTCEISNPDISASSTELSSSLSLSYVASQSTSAPFKGAYTPILGVPDGAGDTVYSGDGGNDLVAGIGTKDVIGLLNSLNDSITGGTGANTIRGGSGNDVLNLVGSSDLVFLGQGHSTVNGSSGGHDTIGASSGSAVISGNGGTDVIILGNGSSQIFGGSKVDLATAISQTSSMAASGQEGDLIAVQNGDNTIVGGVGNDLVVVGGGHDVIVLGPGNDTFLGGIEVSGADANWSVSTSGEHDNTRVLNLVNESVTPFVDPNPQPYNGNADMSSGAPVGVGNDTIYAGNGNDDLALGNGNNYVLLGSGTDNVYGGVGDDTIIAGSGSDFIRGGGGSTYIQGGSGNDILIGGDGDNVIIGGSGASTIRSAAGPTASYAGDSLENNYVDGGSGNDVILGSAGHDTLVAGTGNVTIQGGSGQEFMEGGPGNDALTAGSGNTTMVAGSGNTSMWGGTGASSNTVIRGGTGIDYIVGGSGTNVLYAGDGGTAGHATQVFGSTDPNAQTTIYGGSGVDLLTGGAGATVIYAGDGGSSSAPTVVYATSGNTTIYGGIGTDILQGGSGNDVIYAGAGGQVGAATSVTGGSGASTLQGGGGPAVLQDTESGNDLIVAGQYDDTLIGVGQDTLVAGAGNDLLQNQGGSLTTSFDEGFGSANLVFGGAGGRDNLAFGAGMSADDFAGSIVTDAKGGADLEFDSGGSSIILYGGMTGALGSVTFASGGASPLALAASPALVKGQASASTLDPGAGTGTLDFLRTAFGGDSILSVGGQPSYFLGLTDGETITSGQGFPTEVISSWGSATTIRTSASTGSFVGSSIYAFGAGDSIQRDFLHNDTIHAWGDNTTITGGARGQITVSGANDIAWAGSGSDSLRADGSNDTLVGSTGNASFYVDDASTTVIAPSGGGADTIYASVSYTAPTNIAVLQLVGSANIAATGNSGNDTLIGGAGNDTLSAGASSTVTTLIAGTGPTLFVINSTGDVVDDSSGAAATVESSQSYSLTSNVTDLILTGSAALTATGNGQGDTLVGNAGASTLVGGAGNDVYVLGSAANVVRNSATSDSDTVQSSFSYALPNQVNTLVLTGGAALTGSANAGVDTLVSNAGIDTLYGGMGNDTFVVNNTSDKILDNSTSASNSAIASVSFTLPSNVNSLTLSGTAALSGTGNAGADLITANAGNDTLTAVSTTLATTLVGGSGNDLFVVNNASDVIVDAFAASNDTVQSSVSYVAPTNVDTIVLTGSAALRATANGGGDTLVSNSGIDTLVGGAGADVFVVNNPGDVLLNVGANDTIISSQNVTVPSASTQLVLQGSGAITATTNSGNDEIIGNAGNDTLIATTGQDTLIAGSGPALLVTGSGNDVLVVNSTSDAVSIQGAPGNDTVVSSVNFTLPTAVHTLTLTGAAAINGRATAGANVLAGGAGADTLYAGSGADTLIAGTGPTTLIGGTAADTFVINSSADSIAGIYAGGGSVVQSSVSYLMQAGVNTLVLTGSADVQGTGNASNDTMRANDGNDTLIAGTGISSMAGGMGADLFVINNVLDQVFDADHGVKAVADTIQSSVSYTLPNSVDNLILTGSSNLTATGNQYADSIYGNAGADTLNAGSGNDTLVAGSGTAVMNAGGGNDTFVVNNAADIVNATVAGHAHVIESAVSYTLPSNVNTLLLTGIGSLVGQGNAGDDSLVGGAGSDVLYATGSGNDTLVAGSGATTLVGNAGNDTFVVNNVADSVSGASSTSHNTLYSSVTYVLPAHIDTMVLTGPTAIQGTGNADADTLTGGTGADTLAAGSGAATLIGGSGNTTFVVNSTLDKVVDSYATSANEVQSSINFTLPTNVNELVLTGTSALQGTANDAAADTLVGNAGLDTLTGGAGNDLFVLGNGATVVKNASSSNSDTVQSSFSYALPNQVNTLLLTGSAALTGTANAGTDTLVSNAGVDTLIGGTGNDTFVVNNTADKVVDNATSASNVAIASVDFTLPVNVNALTLTGTAALKGTGNGGADLITANSGNDTLTAVSTSNATTLVGGAGNDLFVINNGADVIVNTSTTNSDTIQSSVSYTASANVDVLVLSGSAALTATANNGGDTLVSNTGVDTLVGGAGADVFVVNNLADVLQNFGPDDTVMSSFALQLGNDNAALVLTGTAGLSAAVSGQSDTLIANAGLDTLTAARGGETLVGGQAGDVFVVVDASDIVQQANGAGASTVMSAGSYALPENVDTLVLTGNGSEQGTGNDDDSNVLVGDAGTDVLVGTAASNTIYGGSGSDTIYAGYGYNVLYAGSGGTAARPTQVYGANADGGTEVQDTLYGGTGVNVLHGGDGDNTIYGGTKTSAIYVSGLSDLVEVGDGGTSATPIRVYGDNDSTVGTNATIYGGAGYDQLYGGAGSDLIVAADGHTTITAGTGLESLVGADGSVLNDSSNGAALLTATDGNETLQGFGHDTLVAGAGSAQMLSTDLTTTYEFLPGFGHETLGSGSQFGYRLEFGSGLSLSSFNGTGAAIPVDDGSTGSVELLLSTSGGTLAIHAGLTPDVIGSIHFADTGNATLAQLMNQGGVQNETITGSQGGSILLSTGDYQTITGGARTVGDYVFGNHDVVDYVGENNFVYGNDTTIQGGTWALGDRNLITLGASQSAIVDGANSTVIAGSGDDLTFHQAPDLVVVNGTETHIHSTVSMDLALNAASLDLEGDSLVGHSNSIGGWLSVNGTADTLYGGSGVDTLQGWGVGDVLIGGAGAEHYFLNDSTESIVFGTGDAALNSVSVSFSDTLGAGANTLRLGSVSILGQGNSANDLLVASAGYDTLIAGSGNDTLSGGYVMIAGSGNDLFINADGDTIINSYANTQDTIESSGNCVLPTNVNTLVLTRYNDGMTGTANSADDLLESQASNDTLVAGQGHDTLVLASSDTVVINPGFTQDVIQAAAGDKIAFGTGISQASITAIALTSPAGAPSFVLSGDGGSVTVQGGLVPGVIQEIDFGDGTSATVAQLLAPSGHATIHGTNGNLIISTVDHDSVVAGSGHDTVIALGNGDTIVAGSGGDVVYAAGTGTSVIGGLGADSLTATGSSDTLHAGAGVATLAGGGSSDVLIAGASGQTFEVNQPSVAVQVTAGYTGESVVTSVDYTVPANVSSMTLATGARNGYGGPAAAIIRASDWGVQLTSGNAADTLVGGSGADTFILKNSAVVIQNAGALDTVRTAVDYVAPANVDEIVATAPDIGVTGNDDAHETVANASNGSVTLTAGSGADTLIAGSNADDTMISGSGVDVFTGGQYSQVYVINNPGDVIENLGSGDTIQTAVSYVLSAPLMRSPGYQAEWDLLGSGNLLAEVADDIGNITIYGNAGLDTMVGGAGINSFQAGTGLDSMVGGGVGSTNTFIINSANDTVVAQAGASNTVHSLVTFTLPANVTTLIGDATGLVLTGNTLNDYLAAYGNSTLIAGSGNDTLAERGGAGTNTMVAGTGQDTLSVYGGSAVQFGANFGNDLVVLNSGHTAAVAASFASAATGLTASAGLDPNGNPALFVSNGMSTVTLEGALGAGSYQFKLAGGSALTLGQFLSQVHVTNSTVTGGSGRLVLNGSASVAISGGSLNDTLVAAGASDTLTGGTGNQWLELAGANGSAVGGSAADTLVAFGSGDTLTAGTAPDTFIGGTGASVAFVINSTSDVIQLQSTPGADTVYSSVNYQLPTNLNTLEFTGSSAVKGVANNGADTLISNGALDTLVGGTGADLFVVNNTNDVVSVGGSHGADTVRSSVSFTLPANVATLVLTGSGTITGKGNTTADVLNASGTSGAVSLVAGNANTTLISGTGVDTLVGGTTTSSADLFVLNNASDVVTVGTTHGADTIQSGFNTTLAANVGTLVLTGSAALTGTGNAVADVLRANSGGDTLTAGSGVATLVGGAGNDLFVVNNTRDSVSSAAGSDTISSSVSYTLPSGVNTLVLTGSASIKGAGNASTDVLTAAGTTGKVTLSAGSGNDTLISGSGVDSLVGGSTTASNDLFVINNASDVVTVGATHGSDTIQSSYSDTLASGVQTLVLTGAGAITGTGNTATSMVVGGTGADTLSGGTGLALLEAGTAGAQVLKAASNQAAMIGGGAADTLTGGTYKDFLAAGKVGDAITTGATANVIAVNKGDGATVINPTASSSIVLSLGGGIDTEGLTFTKSGNNLVLNDGVSGDSVTFVNWYASASNQTTKTLQVIEAASASYSSTGTDPLRNKPIEEFNFTQLVSDFNTAGSPANWSLSQKMGVDTIASSATQDYGGDLAYYFGKNGNITGMNVSAVQSTLTNSSYATALQTIDAWASISGSQPSAQIVAPTGGELGTPFVGPVAPMDTSGSTKEKILPVTEVGKAHPALLSLTQIAVAMVADAATVHDAAQWERSSDIAQLWSSMHQRLEAQSSEAVGGSLPAADEPGHATDLAGLLGTASVDSASLHTRRPSGSSHVREFA